MMGLGLKRNEIVALEREESRTRNGQGRKTRFSHRDQKAERWRKGSRKGDEEVGRGGKGVGMACVRSQTF